MSSTRQKVLMGLLLSVAMCSNLHAAPVLWSANDHSYEYVAGSTTWYNAKAQAEALGGYLATITSSAENSFLAIFNTGAGSNFAWIGGYQYNELAEPDGNWRWVTTEPWSYTNWGGIEPNDFNPEENYAMYNIGEEFAGIHTGQWGDAIPTPHGGDPVIGYFVEYEKNTVVPEPATLALFGIGSALMAFKRKNKLA